MGLIRIGRAMAAVFGKLLIKNGILTSDPTSFKSNQILMKPLGIELTFFKIVCTISPTVYRIMKNNFKCLQEKIEVFHNLTFTRYS